MKSDLIIRCGSFMFSRWKSSKWIKMKTKIVDFVDDDLMVSIWMWQKLAFDGTEDTDYFLEWISFSEVFLSHSILDVLQRCNCFGRRQHRPDQASEDLFQTPHSNLLTEAAVLDMKRVNEKLKTSSISSKAIRFARKFELKQN